MKNISKLEIGYYFPVVTIVELAAIPITIGVSTFINKFELSDLFNNIAQALVVATMLIAIVWLAMLVITIKYQRGNSFQNYWNSVVQTYNLRRFSKIPPKSTQVKVDNEWKNQRINDPAERAYNQAIQGWYIDRQKESLTVWMLLPKSSKALKKIDDELLTIVAQIKQDNQEFIFSPAERVGNFYKIEATRY